jgi:MAPEG family protein
MSARKGTIISIVIGSVTWAIAFGLGWQLWPQGPELSSAGSRMAFAAQHLAAVAVIILLMVSACFRVFDTAEAENPLANAESAGWKIHQRVLQNTIEQSMIFVPAMLALASRVGPEHTRIVPLLTALWCAGRVLFWIGYRIKPVFRGPGFEWTLYSSVAALVWFAATL